MGEMELLDDHDSLIERQRKHFYDRLLMLSDGVFAIAITLLALEIRPPDGWRGIDGFFHAMALKLVAYAISFFVVAIFWLAHRRAFANILRADGVLSVLNLIFLGFLALIPAATSTLYAAKADFAAVEIYLGLILALGLSKSAMWVYASFVADLVAPQITPAARIVIALVTAFTPPLMSALSFFSLFHPGIVGAMGWISLWALAFLIGRLTRRVSDPLRRRD